MYSCISELGLRLYFVFNKTEAQVPMNRGGHEKEKCYFHRVNMIAEYHSVLLKHTCAYTHHILLRKIILIAL